MKKIINIIAAVAIAGGLAACKKESPSAKCYFADVETLAPLGDEYECLYGSYAPCFVAYDGTKVLPVDNDRHYITVEFLDGAGEYFAYAGLSAEKYGYEGWMYGFGAKKGTPAGQQGFVQVTYDDGELSFTNTFNLTAELSGGCEAVNLGLSVKWASFNVGAAKPEDAGHYFAWGETAEKASYDWEKEGDYKWGVYDENAKPKFGLTKYTGDVKDGDGLKTLQPGDDPATVNWGTKWRTPTVDEVKELVDNTKCEWTWDAAKKGYTVKGLKTGNSIFLPAAGCRYGPYFDFAGTRGYYWSSSVSRIVPGLLAYYLDFYSGGHDRNDSGGRYFGRSVRAVTEY